MKHKLDSLDELDRMSNKLFLPDPLIFPSIGFKDSNIESVLGLSRLQIQSTSPAPASIPSPRLYPNGEMVSSIPTKAPPEYSRK